MFKSILIFALSQALAQAVPSPLPLNHSLEAQPSIYTPQLIQRLKDWTPVTQAAQDNPVELRAYRTEKHEDYIGLEQKMIIHASIEQVAQVIDDIDRYSEIFPDFEEIKILSKNQNLWVTEWEQKIPVFFLPNIKYQMYYLSAWMIPGQRRGYRYQLKQSKNIKFSDGIIVLEKTGPKQTQFVEFDFFDADWGLLKTLAPKRIWKDSVESLYLSDIAVKLRAENPDISSSKIIEESKKILKRFPVEEIIKNASPFPK